jgi:hypothetical protein
MDDLKQLSQAVRHLIARMNRIEIAMGNLPVKTDAALKDALDNAIACLDRCTESIKNREN